MNKKFFRGFLAVTGLALSLLSTGRVQAAGLKTLHSHVLSVVAKLNLQPAGSLTNTQRLHLAIGLPLRNQDALTALLQQLYDPASPNYHHYLTPEQFTEMFGPSEQDYQAVLAFAKTNGFTVTGTYSNRMLVDVSGAVADIQRAFHVSMRLYHHPTEHRTFFAPDVEPSVPASLPVLDVNGLNNYVLPRPLFIQRPPTGLPLASQSLTGSAPDGSGSYFGYDFRDAYTPGVSLTGTGQTVALFECADYFDADITRYVALAGLPGIPLQRVLVEGSEPAPAAGDGVNVEVALDIEMVNCMAPGLSKIIVYETPSDTTAYDGDMLARIALDNSAKQISSSWLIGDSPQYGQFYQEFAAQGQSFFQASGDEDAYYPGIFQSEDGTNVTLVGGTTLTTSGPAGAYVSETVWNWGNEFGAAGAGIGSGGGISTTYPIPSWQQGINMSVNQGSTTMRNVPDVAFTADNIYVIADNGLQEPGTGGTSCAAPLWAAFAALVNQQATAAGHPSLGFANPAIYAIGKGSDYTSAFHDITTGNNFSPNSPTEFSAAAGYDLCTGWGTPNGAGLIADLIGKRTGILQIGVNPPTGSALLQSTAQPISVAVSDVFGVTNATITGAVTNNLGISIASLTFTNAAGQSVYSASLSVPAAANPLTMTVRATAPGEIGITNVINYTIVGPPPNDNFSNATKVPITGASYVENNRFATLEPGEPKHDGFRNDGGSLWWAWTPAADTNVFINTIGSKVDNALAVYTGGALTSLQSVVATNSNLILYKPAQLNFSAQAGTTYYLAVASTSSNSLGTVALNVVPGGQPDTNAPVVSVSYPQSGLTVFNPILAVFGAATDPGVNPSGVNQVFVTVNGTQLTAAGTTSWMAVVPLQPGLNLIKTSAVDQAGNVSATVTVEVNYLVQPPANDFFVNAIPLSGNSGTILATNTAATKEVGEPNPAGNPGGKSLWWTFIPPSDGVFTLNTTNSSFDTILGLYTGTNVANLTTIVGNDDAYSNAPGGFSYISQAVRAGQTYYILVDGYEGASGAISLGYSFGPATIYHLTVTASGGGTVQLQTSNTLGGVVILPSASADFMSGANVLLTGFPDHNDQFGTWSGSVNAPNNPLSIPVTGNLTVTANFTARQFTDGFESGDLSHLPWTTAGDVPWFVQTNVVDVGQYAARSGVISNDQSSSLILTTSFTNGVGSFDFKVSSEANFDFLSFYVDGVALQPWSGEIGWANYSFSLTNGTHTLEWTYAKDETISLGMDAAFLDDVNLPIGTVLNNAAPAHLELQLQAGGGLSVNLVGQSNQQYVIQISTDLVHWQNISTNTAVGGSIIIPLPSNRTNPAQFYRAVAP
ncbi:MAG: protease pro-enzyme activation domain-containing protein [Verrucomicrobiota bacterium]|jgi:hypothetical protein